VLTEEGELQENVGDFYIIALVHNKTLFRSTLAQAIGLRMITWTSEAFRRFTVYLHTYQLGKQFGLPTFTRPTP